MTIPTVIADAIAELELYDDTEEARVVRALLAAVLDLDANTTLGIALTSTTVE